VGISVVVSGECSYNAVDLYVRYWIRFTNYYDVEIFVVYLFYFSRMLLLHLCIHLDHFLLNTCLFRIHICLCIIQPSITSGPPEYLQSGIVYDILDTDQLPVIFHILNHVSIRDFWPL
jgi:hypothetical protein